MHTHSAMVTETAIQRRLCESLIDHCHHFFPDLPALPSPAAAATSSNKYSSLSPTSSYSSTSPSGPKYSPLPSSTSSYQGYPPPSYPEASTASSVEHLPHPLADHAANEGITVHMMDEDTPSPTDKQNPIAVVPPTPPNKPSSSARHSGGSYSPPIMPRHGAGGNPYPSSSPVPKPRTGSSSSNSSYTSGPLSSVARTLSGDLPEVAVMENGQVENGPPPRYGALSNNNL